MPSKIFEKVFVPLKPTNTFLESTWNPRDRRGMLGGLGWEAYQDLLSKNSYYPIFEEPCSCS